MGKYGFILFFTLAFAFMESGIGNKDGTQTNNKKNERSPQYIRKAAMDFMGSNATRRDLTQSQPTNPIDNCWRCKPDWADNRQALGQCALGFGKGTTGGSGGEIYIVKDPSDDAANPKEGTLRFGAIQNRPLWITFEKDTCITLKHELLINSDKTIDGRGVKVEISNGAGLTLSKVCNVIIHGLTIQNLKPTPGGLIKCSETQQAGPRQNAEGDGINVFSSSKVWIDHCSLSGGPDGLIDVNMGSTCITISNCLFTNHGMVMLLGADDSHSEDQVMKVSVAYNRFGEGLSQRMPRCRWGFFQVVNNDYCKWGLYAIGGSSKPTIISQGNRFTAPDNPNTKQVTVRNNAPEEEWRKWNWRSQNDLFLNGAFFVDSGTDVPLQPEMIPPEPADTMDTLTRDAGVLTCTPGTPC